MKTKILLLILVALAAVGIANAEIIQKSSGSVDYTITYDAVVGVNQPTTITLDAYYNGGDAWVSSYAMPFTFEADTYSQYFRGPWGVYVDKTGPINYFTNLVSLYNAMAVGVAPASTIPGTPYPASRLKPFDITPYTENILVHFNQEYAPSFPWPYFFGYGGDELTTTVTGQFTAPGDYIITYESSSAYGGGRNIKVEIPITVGFANTPPVMVSVTGPIDPINVGTVTVVTADWEDPDLGDSFIVKYTWGDGASNTLTTTETEYTASHQYTTPGVYTVTVEVTDAAGEITVGSYQYIVVYDPAGGFVTGGGWIDSPLGAYSPDPTLSGKATFGFVSKYLKGATVPSGKTEFQFKAGDLNFHSSTYDWLVIAGAKAQYKGTGTINGAGNYGFMLKAIDAALTPSTDEDKFRISIWDKTTGDIVYDNQMGTEADADPATVLGGGSIVVHS